MYKRYIYLCNKYQDIFVDRYQMISIYRKISDIYIEIFFSPALYLRKSSFFKFSEQQSNNKQQHQMKQEIHIQ